MSEGLLQMMRLVWSWFGEQSAPWFLALRDAASGKFCCVERWDDVWPTVNYQT